MEMFDGSGGQLDIGWYLEFHTNRSVIGFMDELRTKNVRYTEKL